MSRYLGTRLSLKFVYIGGDFCEVLVRLDLSVKQSSVNGFSSLLSASLSLLPQTITLMIR